MKFGIIINSNDPETVWNAFRFGMTPENCAIGGMNDMYEIVANSDRVLTF